MKILTVNNKTEEKFLRQKTADFDFSKYTKKDIEKLIREMKQTMIKANGIGLSANQVGLNEKFFIAEVPEIEGDKIISQKSYAIFNPKITISKLFSKKTEMEEGCLSVPGIYGLVKRYEKITLIGQDINAKKIKIKTQGLTAKVFQHEIDHLNGILFIDKAKNIQKLDTHRNL